MVFIRFQYHLQRHFVVLAAARLVVDITIMQAPIATRRFVFIPMDLQDLSVGLLQVPNKQWGENVGGGGQTVSLPISFEVAFTAVVSADSSWCNASCHITTTTITTMNYQSNRPDIAQAGPVQWLALGCQLQWGYYTAAVGAIYTDVTTPVSFSRCFFAASIDILLAASTTWPGTTQTVWNINASTANKLRFIWAKAPIELDGAVWFGIFIQTVGNVWKRNKQFTAKL